MSAHGDREESPDPLALPGTSDDVALESGRCMRRTRRSSQNNSRHTSAISQNRLVSEHPLSPWRIKVTVEARQEDSTTDRKIDGHAKTITRTISVPLRSEGPDSPTKVRGEKRRPGRPRKSDTAVVTVSPKNRPVRHRKSVDNEISQTEQLDVLTERSSTAQNGEKLNIDDLVHDEKDPDERASDEQIFHNDSSKIRHQNQPAEHVHNITNSLSKNELHISRPYRQPLKSAMKQRPRDVRKVSDLSNISYPTPSPSTSEHALSDVSIEDLEDRAKIGFDTVMESENFTMIDLDSIPSARQLATEFPAERCDSLSRTNYIPAESYQGGIRDKEDTEEVDSNTTGVTESSLPNIAQAIAVNKRAKANKTDHLYPPTRTSVFSTQNRHVTPLPYNEPKIPSPPRATIQHRQRTPPRKLVKAARVLQKEVTPEIIRDSSDIPEEVEDISTSDFTNSGIIVHEEADVRSRWLSPTMIEINAPQTKAVVDYLNFKSTSVEPDRACKDDDLHTDEGVDVGDETEGDIWLAEARETSSSPREQCLAVNTDDGWQHDKPRRALIPSPWKRGEVIDQNDTRFTTKTSDTSFTGIWAQENISKKSVPGQQPAPDEQNEFVSGQSTKTQSHSDDSTEVVSSDDHVEFQDPEDVVEQEVQSTESNKMGHDEPHTRLYETNLENIPEQDLSSSPYVRTISECSEDNATIAAGTAPVFRYRQRAQLSPSKERPNTPRSAMRGARQMSFGGPLYSEQPVSQVVREQRKVLWGKSKLMNEKWEESTTSIRSAQSQVESHVPIDEESDIPEERLSSWQIQAPGPLQSLATKSEETSEPVQAPLKKGWFSWFTSSNAKASHPPAPDVLRTSDSTGTVLSHEIDEDAYFPTTRNTLDASSSQPSVTTRIPSYLLYPSYPSLPSRAISSPLSKSGLFTPIHFRTLHIIHAKSSRPRFHAPIYPSEIRPDIRHLVTSGWVCKVDESETMGEQFEFRIGSNEARVLERFMREIERDWQLMDCGKGKECTWGWSVEEIAEKLARIVVGEIVREEEGKRSQTSDGNR